MKISILRNNKLLKTFKVHFHHTLMETLRISMDVYFIANHRSFSGRVRWIEQGDELLAVGNGYRFSAREATEDEKLSLG